MDPMWTLFQYQGFFTRAHALSAGYDDRDIAAMVRARRWVRVRRGCYVFPQGWDPLRPEARHLVLARCVLDSLGPKVALSHVSGALAHGIATWNVSLAAVHVTRLDGGAGRLEAGVVHHEGLCTEADLMEVAGMRVLSPQRCAIETGILTSGEGALVSLDSVLALGLCDDDQLQRQFAIMSAWPQKRHLHIPIRMATGKSQSAGETRGRWLFRKAGLPAPECQFEVRDPTGELVATCDWGWPEQDLLGEFDGELKYGRLLDPGQAPGDVVFSEKRREDRAREASGMRMVRLVWEDYSRPKITAARVARMLRRAA